MSDHRRPVTLLLALCLWLSTSVNAQGPPPFKLSFEADPALGPGKIAVAQGVTARKLARFAVEALDVSQPVSIVVSTGVLTRPVDVMVVKDSFGTFGWLGLAVGAVAAIGLLLAGVGLLRRQPGGQWCDASSSC